MKIGIDLDEVTVGLLELLLTFYNLKKGKKLSKEDFFTYKFWEVWGGTREDAFKLTNEFYESDLFDKAKPLDSAVESIKSLVEKNEIFIITARPASWQKKTDEWVKKHLKIPCKIFYSNDLHDGSKKTKVQLCKELGVDIMIEDMEDCALDCAKSKIKVLLFDQPWNKNLKHNKVIRVQNWAEAVKEINKIQR
jgi:uncharacterized HAD superfamily protein